MLRRLGLIAAAVAASLTFAASAQAAPTPPGLKPIPYWVCNSSLPISWTPSTPDPGGVIWGYRVDVGDLTAGTSTFKYTTAPATTLTGLIANHHYVVRVRAVQYKAGVISFSGSAADTFVRKCLVLSAEIINRYVEYNPWPDCPECGLRLEDLVGHDPVMRRQLTTALLPAVTPVKGVQLDEQGGIIIIGG